MVIVKYKEQYFLWYGESANGRAKLLTSTGAKFSGTPAKEKLEIVKKKLEHRTYNGHQYAMTKLGVVSCSTGTIVSHPDILKLF